MVASKSLRARESRSFVVLQKEAEPVGAHWFRPLKREIHRGWQVKVSGPENAEASQGETSQERGTLSKGGGGTLSKGELSVRGNSQ